MELKELKELNYGVKGVKELNYGVKGVKELMELRHMLLWVYSLSSTP